MRNDGYCGLEPRDLGRHIPFWSLPYRSITEALQSGDFMTHVRFCGIGVRTVPSGLGDLNKNPLFFESSLTLFDL